MSWKKVKLGDKTLAKKEKKGYHNAMLKFRRTQSLRFLEKLKKQGE